MKKIVYITLFITIIGLISLQFIPSELPPNTPVQLQDNSQLKNVSVEVMTILKTSCYDCHSNQTNYRWYSYVAPASWQIAKDVLKGREALNFSEWNTLNKRKMVSKLADIKEQLIKDVMPMKIYTFIHSDAKLNPTQKLLIFDWTDLETKRILGQ
jgi:hypothetical protein